MTVSRFPFATSDEVSVDVSFKTLRAYYAHVDDYAIAGAYCMFLESV